MKAVWQTGPEAIEKYARSDLRHFKEIRLGEQSCSCQGESTGSYRRTGRVQYTR
jgi:hypothetical protein